MPHSHRYERRRKLSVMYNSARRIREYAESLQLEAIDQEHLDIAMTLAGIRAHASAIDNALEALSRPLAGKPLGLFVRAR